MKRKNIIKGLIAFMFLIILMCFSSCNKNEANIKSIQLAEGCPNEFVIGCFDVSKYSLIVTFEDNSTKKVQITEEMISESDMLKTYRDGMHTLVVNYEDSLFELNVTAKRFEFTDVILDNKEYIYSGSSYKLEVEGALPEGTSVIYPNGNQFIEAGSYTVKATLVNDYYVTKTISAVLKIKPADYDMSGIDFIGQSFVYDGTPKSISVTGVIPKGLTVKYSIGLVETNSMIEVSETPYVVTAHFDAGSNYNEIANKTALLTITKATYDISNVKFLDGTFTYDGAVHGLVCDSKLPNGVTVSYENNNQINAGKYDVVAIFTGDSRNYEVIPSKTAKLTIEKANIELNSIYMDNATFEYDKMPHFVDCYGEIPDGISAVRTAYYEIEEDGTMIGEVDSMINVGYYEVRAYFVYTKEDKNNFNSLSPIVARAQVTKTNIDYITFSDKTFEYDGFAHNIFVNGDLPSGLKVVYLNNTQVEVGTYTVCASFVFTEGSLAERNYNDLASMNAIMKISKATVGSEIQDYVYEYAGSDKAYSLSVSDWEVSGQRYGCVITPKVGGEDITDDIIHESLPSGVSLFVTTKVGGIESQFTGVTNPSSTFINIVYYSESLDSANFFLNHYTTSTTTASLENVTIDGINKQVYVLASKSLLFNITKKHYVPTFLNVKSTCESSVEVTIDVATDMANNSSLSFAPGYETTGGIYTNNYVECDIGIFTGYVDIKLSEETLLYYYDFEEPYMFKYAIKDCNNVDGRIMYDPGVLAEMSDTYDEDIEEYKIGEPTNVPEGIKISFDYSKTLTKPGTAIVKVTIEFTNNTGTNISDGELAKYYYKFPSIFQKSGDNKYVAIVSYTVNKKQFIPTFDTEFEYDGTSKLPVATNLPSWMEIKYLNDNWQEVSLDTNQIIVPRSNPYKLYALLTIKSATMAEYYTVDEDGIEVNMTISKGYFTGYSISGEKVKYDGELHNIIIDGLPDGITYNTTLGEGVRDVGVYDDVIVYFNNNNPYYYDLSNLKLSLTIENNYVEMGRIQAYCRIVGSKAIEQFTSFKGLISKYINLDGAIVEWECHYYKGNVMYDNSYTSRHGSSTTQSDFIFSESTEDDDVCICTFTIKLKNGYVFYEDSSISEFSSSLTFTVSDTIKVDISSLDDISNSKEVSVAQLSTLPELISKYTPLLLGNNYTITSWSADYYDGITPYPDSYTKAHVNNITNKVIFSENDYTFRINTWGKRYCLVTYTITTSDDYCFFDNNISYKSYTGTVKCLVNQNIKYIDDTFILDAITNDGEGFKALRYTNFEDYLSSIVDTNYVDFQAILFDKNKDELNKQGGKYRLDYANDEDFENLTANISFTLHNGLEFITSQDNSYICNSVNLVFDNDVYINAISLMNDIDTILRGLHNLDADDPVIFEQYTQPDGSLVSAPKFSNLYNNTEYSYCLRYKDGTEFVGSNSLVCSIDKLTNDGETAVITWSFIPHNGYYILNEEGLRTDNYVQSFEIVVRKTHLISTQEISEYISSAKEIDQYMDVGDIFNPFIDKIIADSNNMVNVSFEGAYYNGTELVENAQHIEGTSDMSAILPIATDGDSYYYIMHVKLSFGLVTDSDGWSYMFDTHKKQYEFIIRYTIKPITVFTDSELDRLIDSVGDVLLGYSVDQNSLIQTAINTFIESKYQLSDNLEIVSYKILDYYGNVDVDNSITEPYWFNSVGGYSCVIVINTKEGTCMLDDNGKSVTVIEIPIRFTVIGGFGPKPLGQ